MHTSNTPINSLVALYHNVINFFQRADFIPLLLLRLYLAPIFIVAGWHKYQNFEDMVGWFGNADWGLGLPMPALMVSLVIFAELLGGIALLFGILTRFFSLILSVTMLVAIQTVHWQHGWFAIAPSNPATSTASFFAGLGFSTGEQSLANSLEVGERLGKARELLQAHGNYDYLTETGSFVVLNNGSEFAVTYLIMLLVLVVYGAGRHVSLDCMMKKKLFTQ